MSPKILTVDDEPDLIRLVQFTLQMAGYEVTLATTGEEALRKIEQEHFDLVVLDRMLPGISGIEVCRAIRRNPTTAVLPIIMLSARALVKDKIDGLESGADEYVTKPVDSDEMLARVAALLERTKRLQQTEPSRKGKIFGFLGAKGGVGTTTVALNLAWLLAAPGKNVIAAELNPYYGTFAAQLGQTPPRDLTDLLSSNGVVDESLLRSCLFIHSPSLKILFGPQTVVEFKEADPEQIEVIVQTSAKMADYLVLDLSSCPSAATRAAVMQCDLITLVVKPEPNCVRSAKVLLDALQSWSVGRGSIRVIVVNPGSVATPVKYAEIGFLLGCELIGMIPPAGQPCIVAQNARMLLAQQQPTCVAVQSMMEIAKNLDGGRPSGAR